MARIRQVTRLVTSLAGGAMMVIIAGGSALVLASANPSTWITHRLIGVDRGNWVAMRSEHSISSYYRSRTRSEVHVVEMATGCRKQAIVLQEAEAVDEDASGKWTVKVAGDRGQPPGVIASMVPVVPIDWNHSVKVVAGAVALTWQDKDITVIPAAAIAKWAKLQGIEEPGEIQVSEVFEPVYGFQASGLSFIELEAGPRASDEDYARFIVPLAFRELFGQFEQGTKDAAGLARVQPQPSGC